MSDIDIALVVSFLAALFCAAVPVAVVLLVLRPDRRRLPDPMDEPLPKMPAGSLQ